MYCIKCECIPVQKKRRVVAKVQCRNIKNECPEPSCDTPTLLPGRCCKTCPGDINSVMNHPGNTTVMFCVVRGSVDVADSTSAASIDRARYIESITITLLRCTGLMQKWHALDVPLRPLRCCKYSR
ncbi:chordin [Danaus plexippus plexippus]|uniref:Chordin n=1 Tax=Danaus plexippus plexippus TaxID=278856 RepID=A0A212EJD0_DANPL|nr:chordin [Danaus plexippus plexippus]